MEKLIRILKTTESRTLNALLIFVLIIVLAKITDLFVDKVLRRITKLTKFKLDDKIIDVVHKPIFLTIIIIKIPFPQRDYIYLWEGGN